jgi:hypothetical protein
VVERLEGHARRHAAVADERDGAVVAALVLDRPGDAERRGDRGARVAGAEGVVLGLRSAEELGDAVGLADPIEGLAPPREHLVGIALVTDVEDQAIPRRVEDIVNRGQQLDGAQARREVAAGLRHGPHDLLAQLAGDLLDLLPSELSQVLR